MLANYNNNKFIRLHLKPPDYLRNVIFNSKFCTNIILVSLNKEVCYYNTKVNSSNILFNAHVFPFILGVGRDSHPLLKNFHEWRLREAFPKE